MRSVLILIHATIPTPGCLSRTFPLLVSEPPVRHSARRKRKDSTCLLWCIISRRFSPFSSSRYLIPNSDNRLCPGLGSRHIHISLGPPRRACSFEFSTHLHSFIMSTLSSPALSFCDSLSSPDLDAYLDSLSPLSQLPSPTMKEAWWREETLHERYDSLTSDISASGKFVSNTSAGEHVSSWKSQSPLLQTCCVILLRVIAAAPSNHCKQRSRSS